MNITNVSAVATVHITSLGIFTDLIRKIIVKDNTSGLMIVCGSLLANEVSNFERSFDINCAVNIAKAIFAPMSLLEKARQADYAMFNKVNGEWHTSFFDGFFITIRESYLWIPFYFFLIVFVAINFKRNGWFWIIFFLLTAMMSDIISSSIIKEAIPRLRPCRDPIIADSIRFLINYCPQSSSFTSSHAVNHFAAAMFIFTTFKNRLGNWWAITFIWAALISYAQVYVGVHFPLDVCCGAFAGLIIGYLPAFIFNKKIGLIHLNQRDLL